MDFNLFLLVCNYIGTVAFAASGAIKGFEKKLDLFGISLLAIVTAVGGGFLRDSLISRFPSSLKDPSPIYLSIFIALMMYVFVINHRARSYQKRKLYQLLWRANLVFDAIGLIIFSLIGATALEHSVGNMMSAGILASLTGAGGGVIRDLLSNEVPSVLREDIYALLSFFVGVSYYFMVYSLSFPKIPVFLIVFIAGFIVRMLIVKYQLSLPSINRK